MRRPTNPVIPYPHEAIQHTRCVLALSMITVALSLLKPEMLVLLGDLGRQVEKVNRWIDRCADDTQKRRLSAGAKRDLDRRFHILAGHVGDIQSSLHTSKINMLKTFSHQTLGASYKNPPPRFAPGGGFFCVFNPTFSPRIGSHLGAQAAICTCSGTTTA